MRIDAHQHVWNLNKVKYPWITPDDAPIYRTFEASELEPKIKAAGIDKTIVVQAMDSFEDTYYMLDTADKYDWVGGVVGWVPLQKPDESEKKLEEFTKNPVFKGVRHLIHEEKDPDWVVRDEVIEGLKVLASFGLPFDLVAVFPDHLHHVHTIVSKVPDLKIVIDHLAKPPIKEKKMETWANRIGEIAEYPQVYAKVSGLNTAADAETWTSDDLKPYIDVAFEKFGSHRLLFGSDWPVLNLAGDYEKVWVETNKALSNRTSEEIDAVLGGTAAALYNVGIETSVV